MARTLLELLGMRVDKPEGLGKVETLSLDSAAGHLLEECRMVLPGVQALFGFQLIAIFNAGFAEKLSSPEQRLHLAAVALVTVAMALVMAPAAIHRQTQQTHVSERFIYVTSMMMLASMAPLGLGLCFDLYLVSRVISGSPALAGAIAGVAFLLFTTLWLVIPRLEHRFAERHGK